MTRTEVLAEQVQTNAHDGIHVVCDCSPDWSLCGLDRSGKPFVSLDNQVTCVVCADLEDAICGRCGE